MRKFLLFCLLCVCASPSIALASSPSSKNTPSKPSSQAATKPTPNAKATQSKPQAKASTTQSKSTKSHKKPKAKKPAPKLPAQSVLDSMAKKGELIDFGEDNFSHLASKLTQAHKAKDQGLRIAVFGDSHIAGDYIPRVLRERLMEVDSIGFVYPIFPPFHQNLLTHYQHKGFELINSRKDGARSYPLGGIIARAKQEGASIKLSLNFPKDNQDFSVRFVFKAPSTLGAFVVKDSSGKSKRLGAKSADQWEVSPPIALHFPIHIESLLPNALLGGYIITQKGDSYVVNLGINGARSDLYQKWEQGLWQEELGGLDCDLIIISYGSNDAISPTINTKLYKQNFATFIRTLRKLQPKASILLLGAPQVRLKQKSGSYVQSKSYESVRNATKDLAKDEKSLYFDMQELIDESGGKQKWIAQALSKQDVHLTPYGYKLVAESLTLHLKELAQKHAKKPSKKAKSQESKPLESTNAPKEATQTQAPKNAQESQNTKEPTATPPQESQQLPPSQDPAQKSNALDSSALDPSSPSSTAQHTEPATHSLPLPAESSAPQEIWQDLELKDF